jgi:hypothetical protein
MFACLVVCRCTAWCAARIVAGVGDLVQRTKDGRIGQVLGDRQSRGRVVLCAICTVHVETRSVGFLVEPQNHDRRFVSGLTLKPLGRFLRFGLKIGGNGFLVEPQNQGGEGFPGLDLKTDSYGLVIWASKSPRRFLSLGLKTMQASIYRLCHKNDSRMQWRGTCIEI